MARALFVCLGSGLFAASVGLVVLTDIQPERSKPATAVSDGSASPEKTSVESEGLRAKRATINNMAPNQMASLGEVPPDRVQTPAERGEQAVRLLLNLPPEKSRTVEQEYESFALILRNSGMTDEIWMESAKQAISQLKDTRAAAARVSPVECYSAGCAVDFVYSSRESADQANERIAYELTNWKENHIITGIRNKDQPTFSVILIRPLHVQ